MLPSSSICIDLWGLWSKSPAKGRPTVEIFENSAVNVFSVRQPRLTEVVQKAILFDSPIFGYKRTWIDILTWLVFQGINKICYSWFFSGIIVWDAYQCRRQSVKSRHDLHIFIIIGRSRCTYDAAYLSGCSKTYKDFIFRQLLANQTYRVLHDKQFVLYMNTHILVQWLRVPVRARVVILHYQQDVSNLINLFSKLGLRLNSIKPYFLN